MCRKCNRQDKFKFLVCYIYSRISVLRKGMNPSLPTPSYGLNNKIDCERHKSSGIKKEKGSCGEP